MSAFFRSEREHQVALRTATGLFPESAKRPVIRKGHAYEVLLGAPDEKFEPSIRQPLADYLGKFGIVRHRMLAHLLSSQACCFNFLFPFADKPEALTALLRRVFPKAVELAVEPVPEWNPTSGAPTANAFVAFEWTDWNDRMGENGGKPPSRGANSTSTDAAVVARVDGRRILCLIEWKYTESYGRRLPGGERARRVREGRYQDLAFAPGGPIRSDKGVWLTDFFYEPFYQMLRQQILAWQIERNRETYGFDKVRVLHIGPRANDDINRVTSAELCRFGDNAFEVFHSLLVEPTRYHKLFIEDLFVNSDTQTDDLASWREWCRVRYPFAFQ